MSSSIWLRSQSTALSRLTLAAAWGPHAVHPRMGWGSAFWLLGTTLLQMFVHQALLILSSQVRAPSPGGANGWSFLEGGW